MAGLAQRASQAAILSAPAAAPVASKTLAEARLRAREFYRQVCAPQHGHLCCYTRDPPALGREGRRRGR